MPKTNEKDAYYFPHDCNARNDPKILALRSVFGAEGYGVYWMLIEILREQPDYTEDITIPVKLVVRNSSRRYAINPKGYAINPLKTPALPDILKEKAGDDL